MRAHCSHGARTGLSFYGVIINSQYCVRLYLAAFSRYYGWSMDKTEHRMKAGGRRMMDWKMMSTATKVSSSELRHSTLLSTHLLFTLL